MVSKAIIALIEWYRKYISPLKRPCCRFYPSCSRYAADAIRKYGVPKGAYLSIRRIIKCNPFFEGGYDPVK